MEIELLTYKLRADHIIVSLCDLTPVEITPDFYRMSVNHRVKMNALKAAIEIHLAKAKTGKLPNVLPNGLPKDPYSCQDFGYEITGEGFALRCQGKQFQREPPRRTLEFKVRE